MARSLRLYDDDSDLGFWGLWNPRMFGTEAVQSLSPSRILPGGRVPACTACPGVRPTVPGLFPAQRRPVTRPFLASPGSHLVGNPAVLPGSRLCSLGFNPTRRTGGHIPDDPCPRPVDFVLLVVDADFAAPVLLLDVAGLLSGLMTVDLRNSSLPQSSCSM